MSRQIFRDRLVSRIGRVRAERRTRRALELELAGFVSAAERDELELLAQASNSPEGRRLTAALERQAAARLFRAG